MGDLISRQDAIDAFKKELTVGESKGNYVTICSAVGYEGARQILESLPSAQPRKKGKWKPFDLTWGRSVYSCSACGDSWEVPTDMGTPIYNYCPFCGAEMKGGES